MSLNDLKWITAEGCGHPGDCLEVAKLPNGGVGMRNSNHPETLLYITESEWATFLQGAKEGDFDRLI